MPSGLGSEAAGVVEAVGAGVTGFKVGERVGYCSGAIGSYAEANNVPADKVVKLPDGVSDEVAAASMLKGMTAQYLLRRIHAVKAGETIVFHSAAGGVGQIACQWAKHLGAIVIGSTTSPDKVQLAKENGCDYVLNTKDAGWEKKVREITGGKGVPVVYDSIGKDTFEASLDCLQVRGLMVSLRQFLGPGDAVPAGHSGDQGLLDADAADPGAFHPHGAGDAGNRRRSFRGAEIRRGESGDQPARSAEGRRQGAGSARRQEDDRRDGADPLSSWKSLLRMFAPEDDIIGIAPTLTVATSYK